MTISISRSLMAVVATWMLAAPVMAAPPQLDRRADRPHVGSVPYGATIETCTEPDMIALTFDDGPGSFTGEMLDVLNRKNVKATFFLNGNNTGFMTDRQSGRAQNVQRMYEGGHHIASHSWSHQNQNTISAAWARSEITQNEEAFAEVIGVIPTYFRPPFGDCNQDCLNRLADLGYHTVTWSLDTLDWKGDIPASQKIFADAVDNHKQQSFITLSHDIHKATVDGLVAFMIDKARDNGYRLGTLGECLGDPKENWYRSTAYVEHDGDHGEDPGHTPTSTSTTSTPASTTDSSTSTSTTETPTSTSTTETSTTSTSTTVETPASTSTTESSTSTTEPSTTSTSSTDAPTSTTTSSSDPTPTHTEEEEKPKEEDQSSEEEQEEEDTGDEDEEDKETPEPDDEKPTKTSDTDLPSETEPPTETTDEPIETITREADPPRRNRGGRRRFRGGRRRGGSRRIREGST